MYFGFEAFIAITFLFVPIIVLMGTLGYEIPVATFSANIECSTRIIPFPKSISESYTELRFYLSDVLIDSQSMQFKLNVGQFSISSDDAQFAFIPRVGITMAFSNIEITLACFENAYLGGVYWKF